MCNDIKKQFKHAQQTCDFWGFIYESELEWACVSSRDDVDGSERQIMQAIDSDTIITFIAGFYRNKCEFMYNLVIERY